MKPPRLPAHSVADLSEAEFQKEVIRVAKANGWLVSHVWRGQAGGRSGGWRTNAATGFPDLTLLRPPFLVFLELKKVGRKADPEQKKWIARLQRCRPALVIERPDLLGPGGVYAYVVDPRDWPKVHLMLTRPVDYFTTDSAP